MPPARQSNPRHLREELMNSHRELGAVQTELEQSRALVDQYELTNSHLTSQLEDTRRILQQREDDLHRRELEYEEMRHGMEALAESAGAANAAAARAALYETLVTPEQPVSRFHLVNSLLR